jgi:hypothetical protein
MDIKIHYPRLKWIFDNSNLFWIRNYYFRIRILIFSWFRIIYEFVVIFLTKFYLCIPVL